LLESRNSEVGAERFDPAVTDGSCSLIFELIEETLTIPLSLQEALIQPVIR